MEISKSHWAVALALPWYTLGARGPGTGPAHFPSLPTSLFKFRGLGADTSGQDAHTLWAGPVASHTACTVPPPLPRPALGPVGGIRLGRDVGSLGPCHHTNLDIVRLGPDAHVLKLPKMVQLRLDTGFAGFELFLERAASG